MRQTSAVLFLLVSCLSCVSAPEDASLQPELRAAVTVTGSAKSRLIPPISPTPGFANLELDLVSVAALADPATDLRPGGPASLGHAPLLSASSACEATGCPWRIDDVAISASSRGLMAALSDTRAAQPAWHPTFALVVNGNQIQDSLPLAGPITASAPAVVLPTVGIERLATLLSTNPNDLVARGVCLGLVRAGRGEGTGDAEGFANATIEAKNVQGTSLEVYYFNDAMTQLTTSGTNQDGLFVLVNPAVNLPGAEPLATFEVAVEVSRAQSAGNYVGSTAIVRPGVVTVMPMIPRR